MRRRGRFIAVTGRPRRVITCILFRKHARADVHVAVRVFGLWVNLALEYAGGRARMRLKFMSFQGCARLTKTEIEGSRRVARVQASPGRETPRCTLGARSSAFLPSTVR